MDHGGKTAIGAAAAVAAAAAATARTRSAQFTTTGDFLQLLFGQLFLVFAGVAHSMSIRHVFSLLMGCQWALWRSQSWGKWKRR